MLDFKIDTATFASSYKSLKENNLYNAEMRQQLATANNCIAIGKGSAYAAMVAVPRDYPDVVIKICANSGDAFIDYAHMCFNGTLKGPNFLKVFSETEISPGVWLFVLERLDRELTEHETKMIMNRARGGCWGSLPIPQRGIYAKNTKGIKNALNDIRIAFDNACLHLCFDLHKGNVMMRKDGTVVLLDPVC